MTTFHPALPSSPIQGGQPGSCHHGNSRTGWPCRAACAQRPHPCRAGSWGRQGPLGQDLLCSSRPFLRKLLLQAGRWRPRFSRRLPLSAGCPVGFRAALALLASLPVECPALCLWATLARGPAAVFKVHWVASQGPGNAVGWCSALGGPWLGGTCGQAWPRSSPRAESRAEVPVL